MATNSINKETDSFITTRDNPYNPFENFVAWFKYDTVNGYNTCSILDNFSPTNPTFSEDRNEKIIEDGMLKMIGLDYENKYVIVHPSDYKGNKRISNS